MTQKPTPPRFAEKRPIPGVDRVIAVASGKGGVGKSNVTVNMAVTMAKMGFKVGILDADIYGPSIPTMLGLQNNKNTDPTPMRPDVNEHNQIIPLSAHGITCMSIGFLVPRDTATIWRGPMIQNAVLQLLFQVHWGHLDVLFIDLPPGTGDIHLSLAQQTYLSGMIIVSTPQDLALIDAQKAVAMAKRMSIPCLGIVENMSGFQCPHCHKDTPIFHTHGARDWSKDQSIPFLGAIPLHMKFREGADTGKPAPLYDDHIYKLYEGIVRQAFHLT